MIERALSSLPEQSLAATQGAGGAVLGLILLVATLTLVPACVSLARWIDPGRRVFFARWGFSHLVVLAAVFLLSQYLVALLLPLGPGSDGLGLLLRGALAFAPAGWACYALARRTEPEPLRALGLELRGATRGILCGAACYVVFLPGLYGLALLWPWVLERAGHSFEVQEVLQGILALEGASLALALVLAVAVLPFFEELIFRGFIQPLLVQNLREVGGVVVTSALFAGLHGISAAGPVFGLSLLLGALMLRSRRLWAPWAAHALHNGLMLGILLWVPGAQEFLLGP